ncbi:MAG: XrtA-associated tyrosine autokinase [Alphaproteobacteria bacterium]|nr:XrtA-associated tyrosine autokinase [Alphaproteobacteria bacterium]
MGQIENDKKSTSLVERAVSRLESATDESALALTQDRNPIEDVEQVDLNQDQDTQPESERESRAAKIDYSYLRSTGGLGANGSITRTIEEFRLIKRSVFLTAANRRQDGIKNSNLIMVTSSRESEGKTFVSLNLAMSIAAERDSTALLIDADLNNPSIPSRLGIRSERGLIDVLEDESIDLAEVLIRTDADGLSVLPSGRRHRLSSELFSSARMSLLLAEISERYSDRMVILDAPPVLATSEAATLAMHVGQILLVVEAGKTTRSAIKESLNLISICPNVGFVLNKAPFQFGATRFGSYYKYYRKSYYKKYRRSDGI